MHGHHPLSTHPRTHGPIETGEEPSSVAALAASHIHPPTAQAKASGMPSTKRTTLYIILGFAILAVEAFRQGYRRKLAELYRLN